MSDRDEGVKKLAEEIGRAITEGVHSVLRAAGHEGLSDFAMEKNIRASSDHWEARITAFLAELRDRVASLQMDVSTNLGSQRLESERDRALGEGAGLREWIESHELKHCPRCGGLGWLPVLAEQEPTTTPERQDVERAPCERCLAARTALASAPLSERAGEVWKAVAELAETHGHGLRAARTLCLECGPDIPVDEDGCCVTCGRDAVGPWLSKVRVEP